MRILVDLAPEGLLLGGALVCLALAALRGAGAGRASTGVAVVALAGAAALSLADLRGLPATGDIDYAGALAVDRLTILLAPVLCLASLAAVVSAGGVRGRIGPNGGEYHALLLLATLGALLLVAARDLVAVVVAAELLSLSATAVTALTKVERPAVGGAWRRLVLAGAGTAVLLYGVALIYGVAGTTALDAIAGRLGHASPALALGAGLAVAGLAATLGVVPFQALTAGASEGVAAPAALVATVLPRVAGFAALARLAVLALAPAAPAWTATVATLATATMLYGAVAALGQRRPRGLLACLAASQAGFLLMGLLAFRSGDQGVGSAVLLLLSDALALTAGLVAVGAVEAAGVADDLEDYRGLSRRAPVSAAALVVAVAALVGVPPVVSFLARVLVATAVVSPGYAWMLVVAAVATVLGVIAGLRLVRVVMDMPDADAAAIAEPWAVRALLGVVGVAVLGAAVAAQPLLAASVGAAGQLHQ